MKARRNLYIILGALATFFYFGGLYVIFTIFKKINPEDYKSANFQLVTGHIWLIIGLLFFRGAYRIQQKIKQQKRQALENAFAD